MGLGGRFVFLVGTRRAGAGELFRVVKGVELEVN